MKFIEVNMKWLFITSFIAFISDEHVLKGILDTYYQNIDMNSSEKRRSFACLNDKSCVDVKAGEQHLRWS